MLVECGRVELLVVYQHPHCLTLPLIGLPDLALEVELECPRLIVLSDFNIHATVMEDRQLGPGRLD